LLSLRYEIKEMASLKDMSMPMYMYRNEALDALYPFAYNFLLKKVREKELDKRLLDEELEPKYNKPKDFQIVYQELCRSIQNRGMIPNVIKGTFGEFENVGKVLFCFDPIKVVEHYPRHSEAELLKEIQKVGKVPNTNKNGVIPKFCRSVIEAAHFLSKFKTPETFYEYIDNRLRIKHKCDVPCEIAEKIYGMGFALACDFLKEIGYTEFGKPDVHLKDIFEKLGLIVHRGDIETLQKIEQVAEAAGVTVYAVDRVFWIIGSGKFYRKPIHIGKQKENFFKCYKKKYGRLNIFQIQ